MEKYNFYRVKSKEGSSGEEWLLTYSDMITLLLIFFILILTVSTTNSAKYRKFAQSVSSALEGKEMESFISQQENLQKSIARLIEREDLKDLLSMQITGGGINITFQEGIFFESASAELQEKARSILDKLAAKIKDTPFEISVEGHTDNVPISSTLYPSNWELSSARASQVVRFLIAKGIAADRLKAIGYADTYPLLPNWDENNRPLFENQAKNRRVVIIIHSGTETESK